MAVFTAAEINELLDLARSTNTRLALVEQEQKRHANCITDHERFINGNGHAGAKEQFSKLWGRVNMLFNVGAAVWTLTVTIIGVILAWILKRGIF